MKSKQLIISIFLSVFNTSNFALANDGFEFTSDSQCTDKRLDKPPESASKIPVQDQDGTNLCSSYTAAQLIDAWRAVNNPPIDDFTSPLALGVEYASLTSAQKLMEFNPITFSQQAKKLNSCSYNVVKDKLNSQEPSQVLGEIADNYMMAKNNPSLKASASQAIHNCLLKSGMKNNLDIEKISEYMNETSWIKFTNRILQDACSDNKKPLSYLPDILFKRGRNYKNQFAAMNDFRKTINEKLDRKNAMPIGITYCKHILKDRESIGVGMNSQLDDRTCKNGVHASVIVGRRLLKFKNGDKVDTICQYLVRNSYGSSCNEYEPYEKDALPNSSGENPKVCENGQIWVDEHLLLRNTAEVFHY